MKKEKKPHHKPSANTRAQVKKAASLGGTQEVICAMLGITKPTLRKHYREELDLGAAEANMAVAQSLFKMATDKNKPNITAAIFWMKTRAGWTEAQPTTSSKKEQAYDDAKEAQKKFAPIGAPRLAAVK